MSKKQSGKSVQTKATEKARREGVAAAQARIDRIDAGLDPAAEQAASIDVDPKAEMAAAKKHAARGAKPKASKPDKPKRLSALDAAAQVLGKSDKPMTSQALIDTMAERKLWSSPGGKTPSATLYAAMLREIGTKGKDSRFKRIDRGLFAAA